jgi:hypothetical protein
MMRFMSFEPTSLFVAVVMSGIGFALFVYGKKQQRGPQLGAGLALMVYPYFVSGALAMIAVGAAICIALWVAVRLGW